MKRILMLLLCFAVFCAMLGCENPEAEQGKATVYGITENSPLCVTVKCDGDGKISDVKIEEYLSVYDIGQLEEKDGKYYKFGVEIPSESGYAQNVRVGNTVYTFIGGTYYDGETEFDKACDPKQYIECVKRGDFDITDGKNDYGLPFDEYDGYKLDKKKWANKLENGYHEGIEYSSGYKENIYSLITHLKNHGFYGYTGAEKASGENKTFKVGRYDTLVTLENFHDYMGLLSDAYEKARLNVK